MLIADFYANREIFITGGTGFLGKALIDKLLRSCPKIDKIYILLRPKRGVSVAARLEEFSKEFVFERLHRERPTIFKEKVHAITGDCCEIDLGITKEDLFKLKNVSIIFHGAANVRFDNSLANSTLMNVRGTWELVKIAETLTNLMAFIHVSTAYVNSNDVTTQLREEKVVKIPANWRTTIKIAETLNEDVLDILSQKYSNYFPNPYSFTKTLSEQIIEEYSKRLPMVIFRPSIVVSALQEPVPGWLDNFNGPFGMLTATAIGITRYTYADRHVRLSLVSIDAVTRMTVVSAYKKGVETMSSVRTLKTPSNQMDVIHCTGDPFWPLNNVQSVQMFCKYHDLQPFVNTLWAPSINFTRNYYWFLLHVCFFDIPLSSIYDALLMLNKKKPITMKLLRRLIFTSMTLDKFSSNQYKFKTENLFKLDKLVPESEIDTFSLKGYVPHDMDVIFLNVVKGVKRLLKEDENSSPTSIRRYKSFLIIDKILVFTFYSLILHTLWKTFN